MPMGLESFIRIRMGEGEPRPYGWARASRAPTDGRGQAAPLLPAVQNQVEAENEGDPL